MKVLFFGDVVGKPGRAGLAAALPRLRERHAPDLVIANGENTAGGVGITEGTAEELLGLGVDVVTTGNHVYRHRDVYEYLDRAERVIRPANYPMANPGRGHTVVEAGGMQGGRAQPERRGDAGRRALAVRRRRTPSSSGSPARPTRSSSTSTPR